MRFAIPVFVAVLLVCSPVVCAAGVVDTMAQASAEYSSGNFVEGVNLLRKSMEEMWNEVPLTVLNVTFVTEQPQAYGMYTPRPSDVYEAVEPIILYCEPIGYTIKRSGGENIFSLAADFSVVDAGGEVLGGQENFGKWEMKSRAFNTEFMMHFTFNFKGLPSGKYRVLVTLRDLNSTKSAVIKKPFVIK